MVRKSTVFTKRDATIFWAIRNVNPVLLLKVVALATQILLLYAYRCFPKSRYFGVVFGWFSQNLRRPSTPFCLKTEQAPNRSSGAEQELKRSSTGAEQEPLTNSCFIRKFVEKTLKFRVFTQNIQTKTVENLIWLAAWIETTDHTKITTLVKNQDPKSSNDVKISEKSS